MYLKLIETRGPFTKDKLKVYKSLEAFNYFYNGYVCTVSMYCCEGDIAILKAEVNPGQKARDKNHEAWTAVCMQCVIHYSVILFTCTLCILVTKHIV